jgi:hypothetical protein
MVVPAPENGEEIRVSDDRRFSAKRWLVSRLDEFASVEVTFILLSRGRVGVDEHIQLGAAEQQTRSTLIQWRQFGITGGGIAPWRETGVIQTVEHGALRPLSCGRAGAPSRCRGGCLRRGAACP